MSTYSLSLSRRAATVLAGLATVLLVGCADSGTAPETPPPSSDSPAILAAALAAAQAPPSVLTASYTAPGAPASGPALWFRADTGVTTTADGHVFHWTDAHGIVADQPVAVAQPRLIRRALAGHPVIRFDGEQDFLRLASGLADIQGGLSLFFVLRPNGIAGRAHVLAFGTGTAGHQAVDAFAFERFGSALAYRARGGAPVLFADALVSSGAQVVSVTLSPSGQMALERNQDGSSTPTVVTLPTVAARSVNVLGAALTGREGFLAADVAEIVAYDRILTAAERDSVETYLGIKFGVGLPPKIAPYATTLLTGSAQTLPAVVTSPNAEDAVTVTWTFQDGTVVTTTAGVPATRVFTAAGSYPVTVRATNAYGQSRETQLVLTVGAPVNHPPTITWAPPDSVLLGQPLTIDLASVASDPDGDALQAAVQCRSGVAFVGYNQVVPCTYATAGIHTLTLFVTDNRGGEVTTSFPIRVVSANRVPVVQVAWPTAIEPGVGFQLTAYVSDPDGDPLSVSVHWGDGSTAEVTGSIAPAHAFAHAFPQHGVYSISVQVTDGQATTVATQSFSVVHPSSVPASRAWSWGNDTYQQLGNGSSPSRAVPGTFGAVGGYAQVTAGWDHACALVNGEAWCWGSNSNKAVDNGTSTTYSAPVRVQSSFTWGYLSAGQWGTCGVTTAGAGYCWGANGYGQFGNGAVGGVSGVPSLVVGGYSWATLSVGEHHACGVTTTGDAYCMGETGYGALGNQAAYTAGGNKGTPQKVDGGHTWASVTAGRRHTCGITTSGDGYCWGTNLDGQLGNGAWGSVPVSSPVLIAGGYKWAVLAPSNTTSCGIAVGGLMLCWGNSSQGVIGTGTTSVTTQIPLPVQSPDGVVWRTVSVRSSHACAISTADMLYCWGNNFDAQLGLGYSGSTVSAPMQVTGAGPVAWRAVSAGYQGYVLALQR